jgi:chemotaxis protein MotB
MSAPSNRRRRRSGGGHEEASAERWLLTYADMITLLLALFIVLWSISSVNISKFAALKDSLSQAFSGKILQGNDGVLDGGPAPLNPEGQQVQNINAQTSSSTSFQVASTASLPAPDDIRQTLHAQIDQSIAQQELDNLRRVQAEIRKAAKQLGLSGLIHTSIEERGLVIRLLTDKVVFASGQASLESRALPLIVDIGKIIAGNPMMNPVRVEGNTDDVPISTAQYPSNWELSTARATAVLEVLLHGGISPKRLSVAGYGPENPVASNRTAAGRSLNRRVDIVVLRNSTTPLGALK